MKINELVEKLVEIETQLTTVMSKELRKKLEAEKLDIKNLIEFEKSIVPKQLTIEGLNL